MTQMFEWERERFPYCHNLELNPSPESTVFVYRGKNKKRIIITYAFYCGIFKNHIEVPGWDQ